MRKTNIFLFIQKFLEHLALSCAMIAFFNLSQHVKGVMSTGKSCGFYWPYHLNPEVFINTEYIQNIYGKSHKDCLEYKMKFHNNVILPPPPPPMIQHFKKCFSYIELLSCSRDDIRCIFLTFFEWEK